MDTKEDEGGASNVALTSTEHDKAPIATALMEAPAPLLDASPARDSITKSKEAAASGAKQPAESSKIDVSEAKSSTMPNLGAKKPPGGKKSKSSGRTKNKTTTLKRQITEAGGQYKDIDLESVSAVVGYALLKARLQEVHMNIRSDLGVVSALERGGLAPVEEDSGSDREDGEEHSASDSGSESGGDL